MNQTPNNYCFKLFSYFFALRNYFVPSIFSFSFVAVQQPVDKRGRNRKSSLREPGPSFFLPPNTSQSEKIEGIIKFAAQHDEEKFLRQALGHALYTTINIQKSKHSSLTSRRKKRCATCFNAVKKMMESIKTTIGKDKFDRFIGTQSDNEATLMFAVDDTGSMYQEIQAVKDIATYIVKIDRPNLQVDYILSPFGDPGL